MTVHIPYDPTLVQWPGESADIMKLVRLALVAILLNQPLHGNENERASDVIRIDKPFARATIPGMKMSSAFMTFHNNGKVEHLLVGAKSPAARHVELHAHIKENGMMRMRRMPHFHIKPNQKKILKPGGLHIMLIGLRQPLKKDSEIAIELYFDDGSQIQVKVPVKSISAID